MSIIKKPRGTYDLFGVEAKKFNKLCEIFRMISELYNYEEIVTPIFEHKELFIRNIGENSDIVTKEIYDFKDKSDREIALRPENTVSVIRSVIENKLLYKNPLPLKQYYIGPMFRYERPQSGRNRQFNQFGIESIGIRNCYEQVEVISLALTILKTLNIKNFTLKINYIAGFETRTKWINALKQYFSNYKDQLSEDSISRLEKNPLRILDDKVDGKKEFVLNAPKVSEFFTDVEKEEWNEIQTILKNVMIKYEVEPTLVRGLDYYDGLVFEFISNSDKLKGQSTILAGGKYKNLTKELGADNFDCIGFATGIERLMIAIEDETTIDVDDSIDLYLATLNADKSKTHLFYLILNSLRNAGFKSEANFNLSKIDKHFKYAQKFNPKLILIIGDKELENNSIIIKDQITKQEQTISIDDLLDKVKQLINKY